MRISAYIGLSKIASNSDFLISDHTEELKVMLTSAVLDAPTVALQVISDIGLNPLDYMHGSVKDLLKN